MASDRRDEKPGKEYMQKGMREKEEKVRDRKTQKFESRILPRHEKI